MLVGGIRPVKCVILCRLPCTPVSRLIRVFTSNDCRLLWSCVLTTSIISNRCAHVVTWFFFFCTIIHYMI
ncbi:hypothetical protein FKM82_007964 [Ascaphus truei]